MKVKTFKMNAMKIKIGEEIGDPTIVSEFYFYNVKILMKNKTIDLVDFSLDQKLKVLAKSLEVCQNRPCLYVKTQDKTPDFLLSPMTKTCWFS